MNLIYELSAGTGFSSDDVKKILLTAAHRYKIYTIDKKGKKGKRVIAQPAREVKVLQRWVTKHVLHQLPRHKSITAYEKGSGIFRNAKQHCRSKFLLKLDFRDFFPSIKSSDFKKHYIKYGKGQYSRQELDLLCTLMFRKVGTDLCLSIGAPSSPSLSNTILYDFDVLLSSTCDELGVVYTRYADDLAISADVANPLVKIADFVKNNLRKLEYPELALNEEKTVLVSARHRRLITGLVLTTTGEVSLGRKKKREISAIIHKFKVGDLCDDDVRRLRACHYPHLCAA